jgi:hypothetical protein
MEIGLVGEGGTATERRGKSRVRVDPYRQREEVFFYDQQRKAKIDMQEFIH